MGVDQVTLVELIAQVEAKTGWPPEEIRGIAEQAWPDHDRFTPTQAALVVYGIQRREDKRAGFPMSNV